MSSHKKSVAHQVGRSLSHTDDSLRNGLFVSALTVPPQKTPSVAIRKSVVVPEIKTKSKSPTENSPKIYNDSDVLLKEKDKIIKDKEKELKEKAAILKLKDQEVIDLRSNNEGLNERNGKMVLECQSYKQQINEKDREIQGLLLKLNAQNDPDYKALYNNEVLAHKATTEELASTKHDLKEKTKQLHDIEKKYTDTISRLKSEFEEKMQTIIKEKDEQIKAREEKVLKMKKQMAETFTGNSVERQQQIDELTKELTKSQGECDTLRQKLRQLNNGKTVSSSNNSCQGCAHLKAHLAKKDQYIKDRDRKIDELANLCGRFETQLKQQEELIKQWRDSKDRVLFFEK